MLRCLNALLASLELPHVLKSPLELTPSLTLTIFESMLRTRLPIAAETRKCRTFAARVEAMKIFIGVLEDDVLGFGVGLGEIDPRRLANGNEEEILRVAETLCWLGKRMNYLSQDGLSVGNVARSRDYQSMDAGPSSTVEGRPESPSVFSALSPSHNSSLLAHSTFGTDDSQTTVTGLEETGDQSQDALEEEFSMLAPSPSLEGFGDGSTFPDHTYEADEDESATMDYLQLWRASRQHDSDAEDDSNIDDSDAYCHCDSDFSDTSSIRVPVRETGYLNMVDFEEELRFYELRRRRKSLRRHDPHTSDSRTRTPVTPRKAEIITRHTSPAQYTLALLEERARLLSELARLRCIRSD